MISKHTNTENLKGNFIHEFCPVQKLLYHQRWEPAALRCEKLQMCLPKATFMDIVNYMLIGQNTENRLSWLQQCEAQQKITLSFLIPSNTATTGEQPTSNRISLPWIKK